MDISLNVTLLIVIFTGVVTYKAFQDRNLLERLKHHPVSEKKGGQWYRMLTSGFVHADWMHFGINMFVLFQFGAFVESAFVLHYGAAVGRVIYLLAYALMIIAGCLPSYFQHKDNSYYGALGASGAVSGVLFSYILFRPWSTLSLYFLIPIAAIILGVLYLGYSSWASKNSNDNIGHDAHFYGAVAGIVLTLVLIPWSGAHFVREFLSGMPF